MPQYGEHKQNDYCIAPSLVWADFHQTQVSIIFSEKCSSFFLVLWAM